MAYLKIEAVVLSLSRLGYEETDGLGATTSTRESSLWNQKTVYITSQSGVLFGLGRRMVGSNGGFGFLA